MNGWRLKQSKRLNLFFSFKGVRNMKRIVTIREKSNDQLNNRLIELQNSLRRAVGRNKAGYPSPFAKDTMFISKLKKEKARILTILKERELKHNKP